MPITEQLTAQLDRLAATDTGPYPVVSLYLDLRPNEHGRDQFETFLRKEFADRLATYPASGPERESLDADAGKIRDYVSGVDTSVNALALFACHGADLFEAVPLAAPIEAHRLYVSDQPHLYPLARVLDEFPRYLALLTDTNSARIFVFATNTLEKTERIESDKTKRHKKGGWSQARYQRHVDNFRMQHAKEVADAVARIVREEEIDKVFISADEVALPMLREHLPKDVTDRIVDVVKMAVRAPEHEVLESTLAVLRRSDVDTDRARVDELIGAYRANGLACVGAEAVRKAFELGQVDELLITAVPDGLKAEGSQPGDANAADSGTGSERTPEERLADDMIVRARNTAAKVRFIEDATLLAAYGGVGAFLRFKI
jgi:peptide chain release factor subunit 1